MRLLYVSLWTPSCRRSRLHAFASGGGGALVAFHARCHLRDWWSGGDDVGGGRIGAWLGNESALERGWVESQSMGVRYVVIGAAFTHTF